jgi:hypothetical protein
MIVRYTRGAAETHLSEGRHVLGSVLAGQGLITRKTINLHSSSII